jgi:periplasmic protein TonB
MAYAIENTKRRQAQALVGVGLIHGLAIWAIASGFASSMAHVIRDTLVAKQWKDEEVKVTPLAPPPPIKPQPKPATQPVIAPRPDIVLAPTDSSATLVPVEIGQIKPADFGPGIIPEVRPSASASYAVRSATPKGSPGAWVSDRDYPSAAIREEREGVTRFRLSIGVDGRVTGCEVTASSGSPDLDAATCAKVSARARFLPALGSDGLPTTGSYSSSVRWVLP